MCTFSAPGPWFLPLALAAVLVACVGPATASAQSRACRFGAGTGNFQQITLAGGDRLFYVSRPNIVCDDGVRIRADSAVTSTRQNMSHLLGNVWYQDGTRELRSEEARYFSQQGRLQAQGNVFLRDTIRGSEIRNGDLVYLRQTDFRDEEEITVTRNAREGVRPTALLFMRPAADTGLVVDSLATPDTVPLPPDSLVAAPEDSAAVAPDTLEAAVADSAAAVPDSVPPWMEPADSLEADTLVVDSLVVDSLVVDSLTAVPDTAPPIPYEVEADRIFLQGDRSFLAVGRVEMERDSLLAFSDTARYDQGEGTLVLYGSARVEGEGYDLSGRDIHLAVPGGDVRSVRAIRQGVLTGERLELVAPSIEIFLAEGAMERLVAVPLRPDPESTGGAPSDEADLARPVATAVAFRLEADSVEVLAPGQALDRINAVGRARGESTSRDSLNVESLPEAARRDWLEGDTVVATFVEVEPREGEPQDTAAEEFVLERLVARGSARSLYRLLPSDSASQAGVDPPAVHYVTGSTIVIVMGDGDVDRMEVEGPTRGWHLEPTLRVTEDTTEAPDTLQPDTVPPDTTAARRGGIGLPPGRTGPGTSDPGGEPGPADGALPAGGGWSRRRRNRR